MSPSREHVVDDDEREGGWGEWRRLVLTQQEDHRKRIKELEDRAQTREVEQAKELAALRTELKLKSGLFMAVGTIISLATVFLIEYVRSPK
jgi:hypothetical protein